MGQQKGKGKKKKKDLNKGPPKLVVPNFIPINPIKSPVAVKVHHFDDIFLIYTDEYHLAEEILTEIGKIKNVDIKELKLYFSNKRTSQKETNEQEGNKKTKALRTIGVQILRCPCYYSQR